MQYEDSMSATEFLVHNNLLNRQIFIWLMYSSGKSTSIWYVQDSGERHCFSRLKPVLLVVFDVRGGVNHVESICKSCMSTSITL